MESGRFVTNHAPFGYRLVNHRLVVNEQEAEVVREIFAYYLMPDDPNPIEPGTVGNVVYVDDMVTTFLYFF